MAIKTFTTGQLLTSTDTNTYLANAGLVYVKTQSLTSVTNNITSCFSADYDNYLVQISDLNTATTTTRQLTMKMLSGTTPTTDSTYTSNSILQYGASTLSNSGVLLSNAFDFASISLNSSLGAVLLNFYNPFIAKPTILLGQHYTFQSNVAAFIYRTHGGIHNTSTSYNGFQFNGTVDNLSGTVTVYGYRKA